MLNPNDFKIFTKHTVDGETYLILYTRIEVGSLMHDPMYLFGESYFICKSGPNKFRGFKVRAPRNDLKIAITHSDYKNIEDFFEDRLMSVSESLYVEEINRRYQETKSEIYFKAQNQSWKENKILDISILISDKEYQEQFKRLQKNTKSEKLKLLIDSVSGSLWNLDEIG